MSAPHSRFYLVVKLAGHASYFAFGLKLLLVFLLQRRGHFGCIGLNHHIRGAMIETIAVFSVLPSSHCSHPLWHSAVAVLTLRPSFVIALKAPPRLDRCLAYNVIVGGMPLPVLVSGLSPLLSEFKILKPQTGCKVGKGSRVQ